MKVCSSLPRMARVALCVTSVFISSAACAADRELSDGGNIAEAVGQASDGDTIWLGAGTYKVTGLTVDRGVTIAAKAGADVTLDLQSLSDGIVLSADGAIVKGCRLVNCRRYAVRVMAEGAKLLGCDCTGLNEKGGTSVENFSIAAGEIRGCTFHDFTGAYAYKNYVVKQTGGTFADSTLENIKSQFDWMVYVEGDSAVMTNVVIRNSFGKGTGGRDNIANGVLYLVKGLVTHCVITNSGSVGAAKEGTVRLSGGTLRNSLVADCQGPDYLGVYQTGGRLENCTIANNTTKSAAVKAYSINMTGGTAVNNVFSDGAANEMSVVVTGGTFENNLIPCDIGKGTDNRVGIPYFVNPAVGNYAPGLMSPAVDSARALDWITPSSRDLAGEERTKGAGTDMGAFEGPYGASDPLSCGFSVANNMFRADAADRTVVFAARVAGQGSDGAVCSWYVDDGVSPVGTGLTLETDELPPGLHTVKLVVTPSGAGAVPLAYEQPNCVLIYPKTLYVDADNATPASPYDTPAKAATTLKAALDFLETSNALLPGYGPGEDAATTIEVADGTYVLNDVLVKAPVRIVAKAGASPVLDLNQINPGVTLNDPRQVIDGFTVVNGRTHALRFYSGSCLRNCTIRNLENVIAGTSDHFVLVSDSTISNCVFDGASSAYAYWDPVVQLSGAATVSDCLFENVENLDMVAYVNGEKSVVSNCVFRNCPMSSKGGNLRYQAITLTAGLVTHCVITNFGGTGSTGCGDKKVGGVVAVESAKATLRNCLIADCSGKDNAGIDLADGSVENCTVVGGTVGAAESGLQRNLRQTGGRVVNSIFWNTTEIDGVTLSGGTFAYSSSVSAKPGTANRAGDPNLDAAFVPTAKSFARDNGTALDWMTAGAVDLRGSNRVVNAKVDMGAMEGDELPPELVLSIESTFVRLDGERIVYAVTPAAKIGYDPVVDPTFTWTLDGDAAGTSSGAKEFALAPRATPYVVGCSVAVAKQTARATVALSVHNGVFYVSPDGSDEAPYDSWATAAKTLDPILAIPHPAADTRVYTVHLSSGTHSTCGFNLTSALAIVGEDGAVFGSGESPALNHADSSISNLVFDKCGFTLNRGSAHDVVVRNRAGQSGGALVKITGGMCEGLVMTNCRTTAWNIQDGISLSDQARLCNFLIDNCAGYDKLLSVKGSAVVSNGTIRSSCGILSAKQDNTHEYAIYAQGGLVTHVRVTDCGDTREDRKWCCRDGTVSVNGGTVRNCLVSGNRSTDCAGVNLSKGSVESCTVVVNDGDVLHMAGYGVYGSCLNMTGGTATNCVFYSTEAAEGDKCYCRVTGGKIGNCWLSVKGADVTPVGSDVLTGDDPRFKTSGGWDCVPAGGSPLVGKGLNQSWMTGARDFAGRNRVNGRTVDIGAFEGGAAGLLLLVR